MSPNGQISEVKLAVTNNIYTVVLGVAFLAVLITAAFVAIKCQSQYGTIFNTP